MLYVYSDGSASGGFGPGGYGWIVCSGDEVIRAGFGASAITTNNIMELEGATKGVEWILSANIVDPDGITLVSDSQYAIGIADGTYTPKKNKEIAYKFKALLNSLGVKLVWVRGHSGHLMNDLADSLAALGKRGFYKTKSKKRARKLRRQFLRELNAKQV
jgi:ribonuclease HI